jgi:protein-tyrosine phosphatase
VTSRHLGWAGCANVRDLGGLPLLGGGSTRWRTLIRADSLDRLRPDGWAALTAYGVRTVIDLREADERSGSVNRPAGVSVVHVPLDDLDDARFWSSCEVDPPLTYRPFLAAKADRCAAALRAVAAAPPGGVVFHCGIGRDRTGLIALLLLFLAGVERGAIIADYALSAERLAAFFGRAGDPVAEDLARHGTTVDETLRDLLTWLSAEPRLPLAASDVRAIRARLRLPDVRTPSS